MTRRLSVLVLAGLILAGQASAASPCPPGFAQLQNSDACVRISGRVGAESVLGSPRTRASDASTIQVDGRVRVEVRKPTEYGPFRAVLEAEGRR